MGSEFLTPDNSEKVSFIVRFTENVFRISDPG